MNNQFSENLKKIRKENNLSQEQLAEALGVSRQAISKWESSIAYPEMDKIIALCDKFNLKIDDLLHKDIKEIKGEEESKNKLNKSIDDFLNFITDSINLFSRMNFKSKVKCLFEQLIIIFLLFLILVPIVLFGNYLFINIFAFLPNKISNFITRFLNLFLIIFSLISGFIVLVHVFKVRYLDYYNKLKTKIDNDKEINLEENNILKKDEDKIIIRDPKHSEYRFINSLYKLIVGLIKSLAFLLALFIMIILVTIIVSFIISFLVYKTHLFFIGLLIMLFSLAVITIIILLVILNFVFNRQSNKKKMIGSFIIFLITFSVGLGLTLIGTLNFTILNDNETMLKTEEIYLDMQDDLFLDIYPNDYKLVETNIDKIKVEYKINKYCQLTTNQFSNKGLYFITKCNEPIEMTKEFIKNLNNQKIVSINNYPRDVVIYASKENIEKLKANEQNNYDAIITRLEDKLNNYAIKIEEYEDIINILEAQIEEYQRNFDNE